MSDHLSSAMLNELADGELSGDQVASVDQHLASCPSCTSSALAQSLLKSATARAGQRYAPSVELRERLARLAATETSPPRIAPRVVRGLGSYGWAAVAAVLLAFASLLFVQRATRRGLESAGLVSEVCDQHIATLAVNSPPDVISSDRHTVKPWFQGKIPFSFNLPQNLPGDVTLDGANLTYLRGRPTAQLLYSIGKHHVSVFVQEAMGGAMTNAPRVDRSGFHVMGLRTPDLDVVAVSDVDAARLADLVDRVKSAQAAP